MLLGIKELRVKVTTRFGDCMAKLPCSSSVINYLFSWKVVLIFSFIYTNIYIYIYISKKYFNSVDFSFVVLISFLKGCVYNE